MARRSGPPYRRIVVTFWNDPDVKRVLSLEEKAFLAYLFSNEHSHPIGVYRLPPIHVLDELGIDEDRMRELLDGPIAPFATYDWRTEEVFVHNMAEHQIDGGLHGKDRRIRWATTHLQTIHSGRLLRAWKARYDGWNMPWDEIIDPGERPEAPNPGGGLHDGKEQGASDGASEGASHAPSGEGDPATEDDPESDKTAESDGTRVVEPRSKGHPKGHAMPDPAPGPDPEGVIQPPAQSSGEALGRDGEKRRSDGGSGDPHPRAHDLWDSPGVRQAVVDVWHQGTEEVEIHGKTRGLGAEFFAASDLLKATDGDVDLVRWLIVEAPRAMGWDSEPKSLRWVAHGPNLEQATTEYHRRQPAASTNEVRMDSAPGKADDPTDATKRRLRKQYEDLKRAEAP